MERSPISAIIMTARAHFSANRRPTMSELPIGFRWIPGEGVTDGRIELVYAHNRSAGAYLAEDLHTFHIFSDLGLEAAIIWKYDRARLHQVKKPLLNPNRNPPLEYWGDLPRAIEADFQSRARSAVFESNFPDMEKYALGQGPVKYYYPRHFTEADIRWVALPDGRNRPIEIISIDYKDCSRDGQK
jgi:hypothetical protein